MAVPAPSDRRISLIIPCYNAGAYIAEALASALGQSLVPSEILVVDDGSTDDSAHIVRLHGPAVSLIGQSNQGGPQARNAALAHISSPFVAFLDADDVWPADSLRRRFEALTASPQHDYVYGVMEQFVSPEAACRFTVPANLLAGGIARVLGGSLFRRSVFDSVGGFNPHIACGYMLEWISRVEAAGHKGFAIPDVVLRRRIHASNSVYQEQEEGRGYLRALRSALAHRRSLAR